MRRREARFNLSRRFLGQIQSTAVSRTARGAILQAAAVSDAGYRFTFGVQIAEGISMLADEGNGQRQSCNPRVRKNTEDGNAEFR